MVIGILIALQLNTNRENKNKKDLGYKYLTEMRSEIQNDLFLIDGRIKMLKINIKNQEAALSEYYSPNRLIINSRQLPTKNI